MPSLTCCPDLPSFTRCPHLRLCVPAHVPSLPVPLPACAVDRHGKKSSKLAFFAPFLEGLNRGFHYPAK